MRNIIKKVLKEEFDSKSERIKSIVNKYGFVQAIDMIAGGIDTIRNAYQDNPSDFLNQFNDLTPEETVAVDKIYYIDKNRFPLFYYYHDEKNGNVYISYYRIWSFFSDVIGLGNKVIQNIIKKWLEETYNLKGLTPNSLTLLHPLNVGRDL